MAEPQAEPVFGYRRDASWFRRPGTSVPTKVHRAHPDRPGLPACGQQTLLIDDQPILLANVPTSGQCRRCWTSPVQPT